MRRLFSLILLAGLSSFVAGASGATIGDVQFKTYSPLSANLELARRMLSPLTAAQIPDRLARAKSGLKDQPIDLSGEHFIVHLPPTEPPGGYGLLVFVPPWNEARLPPGWEAVLDEYGFIFVSAARSGNDATVLGRREPLALLAEQNIIAQYHVNPAHIFIGGFSGGSRVAMLLALGYPDVFRGAFLDAGSDPIASPEAPLPPRDLFERFQTSSRLVYLTGENDIPRLEMAAVSKQSMRKWCVSAIDTIVTPETGHVVASPSALARALTKLLEPVDTDAGRLASCRSAIDAKLSGQMHDVESFITQGDRKAAQDLLNTIDRQFGGLTAPRSLELLQEINRMPR